ncbi:cysteine-rich RLK (RECEPTOR-like protein kinase) 8 [Striga hermonthica]|uniref:Cysteine-rich RLK (RECEPTOR-like protein kinase) 8 n=1 Tax=Striga hermonthica TaxID=68872 RepID=A0A9N7NVJ3_STRHE|nr:cysteine-rich RLK (RECEPTOR-like protein kinase) 8 [Striga hermonthica]
MRSRRIKPIKNERFVTIRENPNGKGKEKKVGDGEDSEKVAAATDDFLIIYEGDAVNVACQETNWVIDSGASIHVTSRRNFFRSYTPGDFGSVRMGNDGIAKAVGMGDVHLETENGNILVLRGVKHVPNIRMNLISTGKLDDEGFCSTFRDGKWKLTKGSLIVARGQKCSSLYVMNVKIADPMINTVDDEHIVELWHNRLSHMSEKGLTVLAKKNLLPDPVHIPTVYPDQGGATPEVDIGHENGDVPTVDDVEATDEVEEGKFDSFMMSHGYSRTSSDHCVFVKRYSDDDFIILLLYVDDMLVIGHDTSKIAQLKKELSKSFAMKDLGAAKNILGMKISRDRKNGRLWLSQEDYIEKVLEMFNMSKARVEKNVVFSDSQSAIHLSKNSSFHSRSKHIEVRYHWIRNVLESKQLHLAKVHTSENGADMMTKTLPKEKLEVCRRRAGLLEPTT